MFEPKLLNLCLDCTVHDSMKHPQWVIPCAVCEARSWLSWETSSPWACNRERVQEAVTYLLLWGPAVLPLNLNDLFSLFLPPLNILFFHQTPQRVFHWKAFNHPTDPQAQRVFGGLEAGLSELRLGISVGLGKNFQKLISLKAARGFLFYCMCGWDLIFDHS